MSPADISKINDHWKKYERILLDPIKARPIQRKECKRAFFCGAEALFHILTSEISELSDEDGVVAMESLSKQLSGFSEAINIGGA